MFALPPLECITKSKFVLFINLLQNYGLYSYLLLLILLDFGKIRIGS